MHLLPLVQTHEVKNPVKRKDRRPTTCNFQALASDNTTILALGMSPAFDTLEDKDLFVTAFVNNKCEAFIPKSILIEFDCMNVPTFPTVPAILKTPLGSRGEGVYFVYTPSEAQALITSNKTRAENEKNFLSYILAIKGRFPSWILQSEVRSRGICGGRKFHVRCYVVIVETESEGEGEVKVFVYKETEVRIAATPMSYDNGHRDRASHITNGAGSDGTERLLLSDDVVYNEIGHLEEKLINFNRELWGKRLIPEMKKNCQKEKFIPACNVRFAVGGVDVMIDEEENMLVLEVNANPAAPPEDVTSGKFKRHLVKFTECLARLVISGGKDLCDGGFVDVGL